MAKATTNNKKGGTGSSRISAGSARTGGDQQSKTSVAHGMAVIPGTVQKGAVDTMLDQLIRNINQNKELMFEIRAKLEDNVGHFDYTQNGKEMQFTDLSVFLESNLNGKLQQISQAMVDNNNMLVLIARHITHQFGG